MQSSLPSFHYSLSYSLWKKGTNYHYLCNTLMNLTSVIFLALISLWLNNFFNLSMQVIFYNFVIILHPFLWICPMPLFKCIVQTGLLLCYFDINKQRKISVLWLTYYIPRMHNNYFCLFQFVSFTHIVIHRSPKILFWISAIELDICFPYLSSWLLLPKNNTLLSLLLNFILHFQVT